MAEQATVTTETPQSEQPITTTTEQPQPDQSTDSTLLGQAKTEVKEGDKPTETNQPEAKPTVPEKYEIKAPEGMAVDQPTLEALTPVFKKHQFSQEVVQELADAYAPVVKQQIQSAVEQQKKSVDDHWKATVEGWKTDTIKKLGANFDKEMAPAAKLMDRYEQGKELRQFFDETGIGNHPVVAGFMIWLGKSISPDSFADSTSKSTGGIEDLSTIYTTMKK